MHVTYSPEASVDYTLDQDACAPPSPRTDAGVWSWLGYLAVGVLLGVVFVKSEVVSWYRIQEMFRFQSVHMYGVIGVAVAVAAVTQRLLVRAEARSLGGHPIRLPSKLATPSNPRYWLGGLVFGLGWALLGACPGPIFTLIGAGHSVYLVSLASAAAGTYMYGLVKDRLPH
jgi:hypothetical protein